MSNTKKINTQKLVILSLLTAIVIVLQLLGAFIRFGPFSVSLVLMPIVIGASLTGIIGGTWLGLVFGIVVLISGDANAFLAVHPSGTIITVLSKGILAGFVCAVFYDVFSRRNKTFGVFTAAVICPVINTGIFIAGSYLFFLETLTEWGRSDGFANTTAYIFLGMVGVNFIFELVLNILLCPAIVRLVQYSQKTMS